MEEGNWLPRSSWFRQHYGFNALFVGVLNGLVFFGVCYAIGPRKHLGWLLLLAVGAALAVGLVSYFGDRRRQRNSLESHS